MPAAATKRLTPPQYPDSEQHSLSPRIRSSQFFVIAPKLLPAPVPVLVPVPALISVVSICVVGPTSPRVAQCSSCCSRNSWLSPVSCGARSYMQWASAGAGVGGPAHPTAYRRSLSPNPDFMSPVLCPPALLLPMQLRAWPPRQTGLPCWRLRPSPGRGSRAAA